MPLMATDTGSGFRVLCLPAGKKYVKVVIHVLSSSNILMALQATLVSDWPGQFCRLNCGPGIKSQGVMGPKQLCFYAPDHPNPGMAIDAASIFYFMERSKVDSLGLQAALVESRFGLRMAGGAKSIVLFLGSCKGKSAGRQKNPQAKSN